MNSYSFTDENGSFLISKPENISYLYFPLASETGLKSSVTPNLNGDLKTDQDTFLSEPVSSENLHNNRSARNFWCRTENGFVFSASGNSCGQDAAKFTEQQDESQVQAGFMHHTLLRTSNQKILRSSVTEFIPVKDNVEILMVTIENISSTEQILENTAAIPLYGRSADNIRDHRNVTSMLNRIDTVSQGVLLCPTMSFDERGHQRNHNIYYVFGCTENGETPCEFFPTVESFLGEGGSYTHPRAVYESLSGLPVASHQEGKEAMGAFRFAKKVLAPGEKISYILLTGVETEKEKIDSVYKRYNSSEKVQSALNDTISYWKQKVNVGFKTGNSDYDQLMKWICFQPFLRRLFGCSFLPHHDYGRGGRGWRDLWQDCLSLLLMEPDDVGRMITVNYGGVRIDGTNATIIGNKEGEFIADRNGIARVWMDHALWPLMTTQLYIDQTGDLDILKKKVPYFKDPQCMRGTQTDALWDESYGNAQKTADGAIYSGTILEHLLVQHLAAFYEVGDHDIFRLRGADWNDALDMASEHGESVAFTCAYAGNLRTLAGLIRHLKEKTGMTHTDLFQETEILLHGTLRNNLSAAEKTALLHSYSQACRHTISGASITVSLDTLADTLDNLADQLTAHLRSQEWISLSDEEGWFNSYYDNSGNAVEGLHHNQVRMMLTGQVFSIMSKVATPQQIHMITKAADHYLYRKEIGGYRLNTDFKELKFDMGRMFGFAYGEKENGAVFSHMTVMYANALYKRGFAKEGWKALKSLADQSLNFSVSKIYPGIPEYFRSDGRGMYHYLTGAASWFMMTMITEVFGVRGQLGDLIFDPKLMPEQFDKDQTATVSLTFAGKRFRVTYKNPKMKNFGEYRPVSARCDQITLPVKDAPYAVLPSEMIPTLNDDEHQVLIVLK